MKWTYDPAVDALTILFLPGRRSARTVELGSGMLCDYDRKGHPVAIEILDASRHFPTKELRNLQLPEVMVPLSEASKRAGLDASTLRHQIQRKRLRATKRHREWWVKPDALKDYLDKRAPQGRRSDKKGSDTPGRGAATA